MEEEPFQIRSLKQDDLPRILQIEQASFSVPWRQSTFEGLLRRSDTDLLGAERGGELIGYAVSWTVVDQAELGNIAVAPEARGDGAGAVLLNAMMQRLAARGARECFLEVRVSNQTAQRLYTRHGFEVIGERPRYYTQPLEDAFVMRLSIANSA